MGFLFWRRGKKSEEKHKEIEGSINSIKDEFGKVAEWIKHLHSKNGYHEENLNMLNTRLSSLETEVIEIKDLLSFFGPNLFKRKPTDSWGVQKQPNLQNVQTYVRAAKKGGLLRNLTTMERAIIWVLLNTDLKLSYEDIAAILGKNRATIRGQVNSIKQKSEGLVQETLEITGKKRIYIEGQIKEALLKSMKVVEKEKNSKKREKKEIE